MSVIQLTWQFVSNKGFSRAPHGLGQVLRQRWPGSVLMYKLMFDTGVVVNAAVNHLSGIYPLLGWFVYSLAWGALFMLENFINEKSIISILCNKRIKLRQKNRKNNFINSISALNNASTHSELLDLLPPRKFWPRPSKKNRLAFDDNDLMYSKYLFNHVVNQYYDFSSNYKWKVNLKKFIDKCKKRIDNIKTSVVSPEKIIAIPKDASSKSKNLGSL
jgi:hypothetical protein